MSIAEVGPKYRVTITQAVRKKIPVKVGQKIYLLARSPYVILIPIPEKIDGALAELLGDITYSREERKQAEEQLLKEKPFLGKRFHG
jgi:bifunctional DNA-binding transcriptional regulator/antitoxin component of YhaV-PrlF toxin-antitoxin module